MKTFMLMTGSGPLMILTSHTSIEDPLILEKLVSKGIEKFLAYEVPYIWPNSATAATLMW